MVSVACALESTLQLRDETLESRFSGSSGIEVSMWVVTDNIKFPLVKADTYNTK